MKHFNMTEKKLFITDMSLLIIFLFSVILVFVLILFQILYLLNNNMMVRIIILTVSSITAISIVWATVEIMVHLQRNQGHIYKEDLICQKYILERKRALLYEKQ